MRRFVALSLSFFILVNCFDIKSSASFVNIKPTMSPDSGDIVEVSYIPPTQQNMPYFNDAMSSFCIGLIKFELKNPQNFMPNVKVRVKVAPPPSMCQIMWNKFKSMVWPPFKTLGLMLLGEALTVGLGCWLHDVNIKENILNFINGNSKEIEENIINFIERRPTESNAIISGGGILGIIGSFLLSDGGGSDSIFKMTINGIPFKFIIIPISLQEAKMLQANKVIPGEKKEGKKEHDQRYKEIQDANGPTLGEFMANEVLLRGCNILDDLASNDSDFDPGDPFGLIENAKFLKLDGYKYPRNFKDYFSDKESKAINKQNAMKKRLFCKIHSDDKEGINISNYFNEILATLSRDNPVQYAAIMVNNSVEAAKLRKLLERAYSATSPLSYRLNSRFSTKTIFYLPKGSEFDKKTEREAEIALGTGPSWPARIVSFLAPNGVAEYVISIIDFFWKPIYSGGVWACDKFKSKFLIEKDPPWVIPQDDNPPWVVPEVEPGVDPPWTIPPKADPWYKRGWDKVKRGWNKVKSWFSFEIDPKDINLAGTLPSSLDNLANMPPQAQQNQNNQQQPGMDPVWALPATDQHYNNNPSWVIPQENSPANDITDNSEKPWVVQDLNANAQLQQVDATENDRKAPNTNESNEKEDNDSSSSKASEPTDNSEANRYDNSKESTSSADKNDDDDWEESSPEKKIDLNAIPRGKNKGGNIPQNSTQSVFKVDDKD